MDVLTKNHKFFVAGGTGFLGTRVVKRLQQDGIPFVTTSLSMGVDFRQKSQLEEFFEKERPDGIINCAAFVGGIRFGLEHEGEIYYNNTLINTNLLECARTFGVQNLINPISNCSYPDVAQKDFKEEEWWDGPLHPSVLVYGFVKKATWIQSYAYHRQYGMNVVNLLVPNMYGPNDHFNAMRSHALGALIMKMVSAKRHGDSTVVVWGTGSPVREWLYVDDCVEAMLRCLDLPPMVEPMNIGQSRGVSIKELASMIQRATEFEGELKFDTTKPDGAPYKVMNVDRMESLLGWRPPTTLEDGIRATVEWYQENVS